MLVPTPPERLLDTKGRPYFLWDCALSMPELRERLNDPDRQVRAYWAGKVMRQAGPETS